MISAAELFSLANTVALVAWLVLVFAPRSALSHSMIRSLFVPVLLCLAYVTVIVFRIGQIEGGFGSLVEAQKFLANPWGGVAGWIHFLAFDLFIGVWIVGRSETLKIPHLVVVPFLGLTLMFGPMGLLAWCAYEAVAPAVVGAPSRWMERDRGLTWMGIVLFGLGAVALIAAAFDGRRIDASLVWIKPAKFFVSLGIYVLTLVWFLARVKEGLGSTYAKRLRAWTLAVIVVEMGIICFQAARGVRSHFNTTSEFDRFLYGTMGVFIVANLFVVGHFALTKWLRSRDAVNDREWLGGFYGLVMFLIAGVLGMIMAAQPWSRVGAEDAAGVVLFFGWNQAGGDLRISHFIGLHGLQVLPIVGWLAQKKSWRPAIIHAAGTTWIVGTIVLFVFAWQGIPLLRN